MANVEITPLAGEDLDELIASRSLPTAKTKGRIRRTLATLERFPRSGKKLDGRWSEFRVAVGPWRWLIAVYTYDESDDRVVVVAFHDARTAGAATSEEGGA